MKKFPRTANWLRDKSSSVLGERNVCLSYFSLNIEEGRKQFQVFDRGGRFLIKIDEGKVSIVPVDLIGSLLWIFPAYYFRGKCMNEDTDVLLVGKILMSPLPKYVFIFWMSIVLLVLALGAAATVCHSFMYFLSNNAVFLSWMYVSAMFFGGALGLALFGFLVIGLFKFVKKKELKRIEYFLKHLDTLPL